MHDRPPQALPTATLITVMQLAHVCALLGLVNMFVLSSARWNLHPLPDLQEKIVFSLLAPLLAGDFFHLYITLSALGDERWNVRNWSPMLWTTVLAGLSLMFPRIAWHLGVGRYVHARDGNLNKVDHTVGPAHITLTQSTHRPTDRNGQRVIIEKKHKFLTSNVIKVQCGDKRVAIIPEEKKL